MAGFTGMGRWAAGQLAQLPMFRWGLGLGAIVLAISSLFGGLDTAEEKNTAVNAEIDGGPWKVTVTGARLVGELPPMRLSDKNNLWIVVLATVEITADHTWSSLGEVVQLAPVEGVKAKVTKTLAGTSVQRNVGIVLMRDATRISQLNPGMPEKLAFFWELTGTSKIPAEVKVYIGSMEHRRDNLTSHMSWMDDSARNKPVVVPVVDRRAATAGTS